MKRLSSLLIDYSLLKIYEYDYFYNNLILPIGEDDICLKLAICKESNLNNIKEKITRVCKYIEFTKEEILFFLSNHLLKIQLYENANKSLLSENFHESFLDDFFSKLLLFSIDSRASDIHIEVYKNLIQFRFRIDGRLKIFFSLKKEFFKPFSSYIKLMSNLDITQNRMPLNSRFSKEINNKTYDFRLSTMPTISAESIVVRILDKNIVDKSIFQLGLSSKHIIKLKESINLKQGLILIAGPTGSGKTTTLYSILKELESEEKKIITIEDPVEYKIDEINQIPINEKLGLNYELALKNILRQDPDIILIGEIRDEYSLKIALRASLTGHLVLASIHANNAVETITRLMDLYNDSFLIASSLKLIIAQRLVLRFCSSCNAQGCKKCNFTKFFGRTSISEVLQVDDNISSIILKKGDIKSYLKTIEFESLLDSAKEKVALNISSMNEVYKVL